MKCFKRKRVSGPVPRGKTEQNRTTKKADPQSRIGLFGVATQNTHITLMVIQHESNICIIHPVSRLYVVDAASHYPQKTGDRETGRPQRDCVVCTAYFHYEPEYRKLR